MAKNIFEVIKNFSNSKVPKCTVNPSNINAKITTETSENQDKENISKVPRRKIQILYIWYL